MKTAAQINLTEKQIKNIKDFEKLMKNWDRNLCLNAIAGKLHIMLLGDTEQNPIPEMSDTGGFNPKNDIISFSTGFPISDGGDW